MPLSEIGTMYGGNVSNSNGRRSSVELLIAQLNQTAEMLEEALREEVERSPVKDPAAVDYPMLARSLGLRLSNLRATIAAIEAASPNTTSGPGGGVVRHRWAPFLAA